MKFNTIMVSQEAGVSSIALNRPDKLNAVNEEMVTELNSALAHIARDDDAKVVVLTGAGKAFCAGADLGGRPGQNVVLEAPQGETVRRNIRENLAEIARKLHYMEKPTIAMVNGAAVGAGFSWAVACDMRTGSDNARFRVVFASRGLVPGSGDAWFLPRIVGTAKAAELLFSQDFIDGKEAYRVGLLNQFHAADKLESETLSFARRLAQSPPISLRLNKLLLYRGLDSDLETALDMASGFQAICMTSEDFHEAVASFREKRPPVFKGK